MKTPLLALWIAIKATAAALSAPVGICLHSYSPETPADKIECFEFERFERLKEGYRFFLPGGGSVVVTRYRFRGTVSYKPGAAAGTEDFKETLKLYEETSRTTPSSRAFLNSKIVAMRGNVSAAEAQRQRESAKPKITIEGVDYWSPKLKGFDAGLMVLSHRDGFLKMDPDKLSDSQIQELSTIDAEFKKVRMATVARKRLWNPTFAGTSGGIVKLRHEKGILESNLDDLSEQDRRTIMDWSDGSWKLGKPGFYRPNGGSGSYDELILDDGKFHTNVKIVSLSKESVVMQSGGKEFRMPIGDVAKLGGLTKADDARIGTWVEQVIDQRVKNATPEVSRDRLSFKEATEITVTDVSARVLQVLNDGVLVSEFEGKLHTGTETVQTTRSVTVEHPVTGKKIQRTIGSHTGTMEALEDVTDDLCFIAVDSSNLTENQIININSMKRDGSYKYISVLNAPRTVRRYKAD